MKTLIRQATTEDLQTLFEIDQASFSRDVAYDSFELSFLMGRPGAETLVLEANDSIVAFLLMDVNRRRKQATLVTLDVREEVRRKGYATELLERSEDILREYGVLSYTLQVDTHNDGAIAFYEKHGFRQDRRLKNYYPGGRDAWQMTKRLPTTGGA